MISYDVETQSIIQGLNKKDFHKYYALFHWSRNVMKNNDKFYEYCINDDMYNNRNKFADKTYMIDGFIAYQRTHHFDITYNLQSINLNSLHPTYKRDFLSNQKPAQDVFEKTGQKVKHLKQALSFLIDIMREENQLVAIPFEFKETYLYQQIINEVIRVWYKDTFYDVTHFINNDKIDKIHQDLTIILSYDWKKYTNIQYKLLMFLLSKE